jgi:hypothetical protein
MRRVNVKMMDCLNGITTPFIIDSAVSPRCKEERGAAE